MAEPIPQSHQPQVDIISSAYREVLEHNKKHTGFGALFGGILNAAMEKEETEPEASAGDIYDSVNVSLGAVSEEGQMYGELQTMFHADAFSRIGIDLSDTGSFFETGDGQKATSAELKPRLKNTELFAEFIEGLDKDTVGEDEGTLKLVSAVNLELGHRIRLCFSGGFEGITPEQEAMLPEIGEDALRSFVRLEAAYETAGLARPKLYDDLLTTYEKSTAPNFSQYLDAGSYMWGYENLVSYVEYWGKGVLPERISIDTPESNEVVVLAYFDGLQDRLVRDVDDIISVAGEEHSHAFGIEVAKAKLQGLQDTLQIMVDEPDHWIGIDKNNKNLVEDNIAKLEAVVE